MKHRYLITVVSLIALSLSTIGARDVSVSEAIDAAMNNNKQLQSAEVDLKTSQRADKNSWNGFLPTVQATGTLSHANSVSSTTKMANGLLSLMDSATSGGLHGYQMEEKKTWATVFGLSLSFNFNPALITNIQLAKAKLASGELTYAQARAQTQVNVEKLYWGIALQEESLKLQKATLANTKDRMDQTKALYDAGYVNELSYLQAQVGYENLKPNVDQSVRQIAEQKRQFAFLLGFDPDEEINLTSSIEKEEERLGSIAIAEDLMFNGLSRRFDISALNAQNKVLSLQQKAVKDQIYFPTIALSASFQPVMGDITNYWWDKDNWFDNGSVSMTVAWNLTNLLPWSSASQSVKDMDDAKEKIAISQQMMQDNARIEIKSLLDKINQSKDAIASSTRSIALAQQSYDMTCESYANGTSELLNVRDAENQLNQAKLGRLSNEYTYLSALIDLEYATQQTIR